MTTVTPTTPSASDQVDAQTTAASTPTASSFKRIDHIALAVRDLEDGIRLFRDVLGFELKERWHIKGKRSGMISAEMDMNGIRFVLCQGTDPESPISRMISDNGAGIAHIAMEVDDVDAAFDSLGERGLSFDTNVIRGSGLTQAFSSRCDNTGMSFELIHRSGEQGFLQGNVQDLFDQLESATSN